MNTTFNKTTLLLAPALLLLSACNSEEPELKPLTTEEKIIAPADSTRNLLVKARELEANKYEPKPEQPEVDNDSGADSMSAISFDGSSQDAFTQGLKEFQEIATNQEYSSLTSSLSYLLMHDLSAGGKKAKLYRNLDGLTPAEILERASQIGQ